MRVLSLPVTLIEQMLDHCISNLPNEACGFVGGLNNIGRMILPVRNSLSSPYEYKMDPVGQLLALRTLEDANLDVIAYYHSHPSGPRYPSNKDLAEFHGGDCPVVICSPDVAGWQARAFRIINGHFVRIRVELA